MRKFSSLLLFFLIFLLSSGGAVWPAEAPDEAQLSADRMRFDSRSGYFEATGNVVIKADGLTVRAPQGTGNVKNKEIHFTEGIVASGDWQGEWIDLVAGSISLYFAQTPTYTVEGGVKGDLGRIYVDADKLYMKGVDISAKGVRRLEDRETDVAFGAEDVFGTLVDGVLTSMTAKSKVWLQGRPNSLGDMVDIRGDTAVYSVERGSVVLSGNVRAVQQGRSLTAQSLVYFPSNNRIDALGDSTLSSPARITIDLNRERERNRN